MDTDSYTSMSDDTLELREHLYSVPVVPSLKLLRLSTQMPITTDSQPADLYSSKFCSWSQSSQMGDDFWSRQPGLCLRPLGQTWEQTVSHFQSHKACLKIYWH